MEDKFKNEFELDRIDMLEFFKHFKLDECQEVFDFEMELVKMLNESKLPWLGVESRFELKKQIPTLGPVTFIDGHLEKDVLIRLKSLVSSVVSKRRQVILQM